MATIRNKRTTALSLSETKHLFPDGINIEEFHNDLVCQVSKIGSSSLERWWVNLSEWQSGEDLQIPMIERQLDGYEEREKEAAKDGIEFPEFNSRQELICHFMKITRPRLILR